MCYNTNRAMKISNTFAGMMELADVLDSKSSGSDTVRVRPPLPAPKKAVSTETAFFVYQLLLFTVDTALKNTSCSAGAAHRVNESIV